MESLEIHFKGIILSDLYCDPRKKRIQYDILDKLQIKLLVTGNNESWRD